MYLYIHTTIYTNEYKCVYICDVEARVIIDYSQVPLISIWAQKTKKFEFQMLIFKVGRPGLVEILANIIFQPLIHLYLAMWATKLMIIYNFVYMY